MTTNKPTVKAVLFALSVMGFVILIALAARAGDEDVCAGLDSGKIDTIGDPETITASAPDGYKIDGYCVKAGSIHQGNGPEYVTVDPPLESITFAHSSGKEISHYSVSYIEWSDETTTTTTIADTTTTTVEATTTTASDETTTTAQETTSTTIVDAPTPADDPTLPFTGINWGLWVAVALALMATGGLALRVSRG